MVCEEGGLGGFQAEGSGEGGLLECHDCFRSERVPSKKEVSPQVERGESLLPTLLSSQESSYALQPTPHSHHSGDSRVQTNLSLLSREFSSTSPALSSPPRLTPPTLSHSSSSLPSSRHTSPPLSHFSRTSLRRDAFRRQSRPALHLRPPSPDRGQEHHHLQGTYPLLQMPDDARSCFSPTALARPPQQHREQPRVGMVSLALLLCGTRRRRTSTRRRRTDAVSTGNRDRPEMRKCWAFLDATSRSFAAVIHELDGDLSRVVSSPPTHYHLRSKCLPAFLARSGCSFLPHPSRS